MAKNIIHNELIENVVKYLLSLFNVKSYTDYNKIVGNLNFDEHTYRSVERFCFDNKYIKKGKYRRKIFYKLTSEGIKFLIEHERYKIEETRKNATLIIAYVMLGVVALSTYVTYVNVSPKIVTFTGFECAIAIYEENHYTLSIGLQVMNLGGSGTRTEFYTRGDNINSTVSPNNILFMRVMEYTNQPTKLIFDLSIEDINVSDTSFQVFEKHNFPLVIDRPLTKLCQYKKGDNSFELISKTTSD